ncbi:hypothetical protein M413DRAFT_77625 [Hebeloma cylindrosporum]|uniref:C3H1-type domain-containing protein n=1 Tax=Hebeloma cylindrosporum TaxID=76867 RepID=A0A0C2Y763_HEBCY|nr:hypothetical protein M413DRAFT_77625 [Hebeloma cylindrosporum h7]
MSKRSPPGVPTLQWEQILRGEVLDLDQFFTGVVEAKRRVSTASDWSSAWHLASRAVEFAFPNCARELADYGRYIESKFSAKLPSAHSRVILFDISIRNIVQGGQCRLLTDKEVHLNVYSSVLLPEGINSNVSNRKSNPGRPGSSKSDFCNRFNTASSCPSSDFDCRFRHSCKKCKKKGHGQTDCSQ